tara:strand:- start:175 stop:570 length:396 start_codon:yes stop_codon:yes gene_type:complete
MSGDEFLYSEQPALDQLQSNGWFYKDGKELAPETSNIRSSLKEVILTSNLEKAIQRINPWISNKDAEYMIFKAEIKEKSQIRKALSDVPDSIVEQFEKWWDKYGISLAHIDSEIQGSEIVMYEHLKELGYA